MASNNYKSIVAQEKYFAPSWQKITAAAEKSTKNSFARMANQICEKNAESVCVKIVEVEQG